VTAERQNDLAVAQEIERKFLVGSDRWRDSADAGRRLRQAYLAETDRAVIRVRIEEGGRAFLTLKSAAAVVVRDEFEYSVPLADAEALLRLRHGSVLEKTRFLVRHAGRVWEVDLYSGDNAGLVIAEIELEAEAAEVDFPPWLGREVTGEARYYASRLALAPFPLWPEAEQRGAGS